MSKAVKETDSTIEKTIWRSRKEKKTKSLIDRETQLRHFRRSNLAKDTIKRIALHTTLARIRYSGWFGDKTWGESKRSLNATNIRLKVAEKRRRRCEKRVKAVSQEVAKAQQNASRGTETQKTSRGIRKPAKATTSKLQSSAVMNSEAFPSRRGAVSASFPKWATGVQMHQTAKSGPLLATTEHIAESDDKGQNGGHLGAPGANSGHISDVATGASSQAGHKLSSLPLGPLDLAIPTKSLPVWAQWFEPPLSATQVERMRKRMRQPAEYLSIGLIQRKKAVADDLSAALRSIRQTSNQSIKFHWKYLEKLKQEFLRPRSDEEGKIESAPERMEARSIDNVSSKKSKRLTELGDQSCRYHLRPKTTYSANSSLLERTESSDHPSHEIRKIRLRRHGDVDRGSQGKAHVKRSDKPGQLWEDLSGRQDSSMARSSGIAPPFIYNKAKTAMNSESESEGHINPERRIEKEMAVLNIPADTDMATDLRAYSQWPDDSGALKSTNGCLLPAKYRFSGLPGFEWICPVRTCQRCYGTQRSLGFHFISMHHSCLLNDNRDGTFTLVGKYDGLKNMGHCPAMVKTKDPLPECAPPPVGARPPATWVTVRQQESFAAIKSDARVRGTLNLCEEKTVDELMLFSSYAMNSSAEVSEDSELSDNSPATPRLDVEEGSSKPEASSGSRLSRSERGSPEDQIRSHTSVHDETRPVKEPFVLSDVEQENWSLVGKFLDGRQAITPKRGYFATLLSSPRSRDIVTRPGLSFVADQPKKVRLLMVHLTGKEPPVPCNSCALGRGPFKKCVSVSKKAAGETTNGIVCCTNCAGNGILQHSCNVEELLSQPPAAQLSSPHKEHKKHRNHEPKEQASSGISSQITKIDSHFTLTVHFLKIDGSLELDAAPSGVRLCSLTTGKVLVELQGNSPFLMGAHGMFKIMPTIGARISNATETEAILHVSTVKS